MMFKPCLSEIGLLFPVALLLLSTRVSIGTSSSDVEEILLNVDKISKLGDADILLSTISRLALALNKCGVDVRGIKELQRVMLPTGASKCMDGSNAGYYMRQKTGSKRWLIFLEGGYHCFDKKSCKSRSLNEPNLTSSTNWPLTKEGSGILSWNPEENPFLFSANIVYIPYCSSDAWSGNSSKSGLFFMGSTIIDEVITDLLKHGLQEASKLFVAGSSAGATGVLLNIDRVSEMLAALAPGVNVHGIVDSGWFLDKEQYIKTPCTSPLNCSPVEVVKRGFRLWKSRIPKSCRNAYKDEPWRCFFGYKIYPYIKTPIFVIAYMYDRAQLLASMGGGVSTYHEVQQDSYAKRNTQRQSYVLELAKFMNSTLANVSAVFAPSCMDHEVLTRSMWHSVAIHGTTLVDALRCWEGSQEATNRVRPLDMTPDVWISEPAYEDTEVDEDVVEFNVSDNTTGNKIRHDDKKRRKQHRQRQHRQRIRNRIKRATSNDLAAATLSNRLKEYRLEKQAQCAYRLYDHCSTPNCNLRCPTYMSLFSNNNNANKGLSDVTSSYSALPVEELKGSIKDPVALESIINSQR